LTTRFTSQRILRSVNFVIGSDSNPKRNNFRTLQEDINPKSFLKFFWRGRQVVQKKTPELAPYDKDIGKYDTIIIGTPVWAFNYAPPIRSFLSEVTIKDKKLAFFCCHEGTPGKTLDNLEKDISGNTIIGKKDYVNVFKDKEENILKARNWALSLKNL
jgi:flavodoxin